MKSWLQKIAGCKMAAIHNDGKSVVAERFIETFKNKRQTYNLNIKRCLY